MKITLKNAILINFVNILGPTIEDKIVKSLKRLVLKNIINTKYEEKQKN